MSDAESNEKLGERAREFMRSLSTLADMAAIQAPTPVISRQLDELKALLVEIDTLAGTNVRDIDFSDTAMLMRLYQVAQLKASAAKTE